MELIDDVARSFFFSPHTNVRVSSGTFFFPWRGCECVGRFATPTSRVHGKQIYGSSQVVGDFTHSVQGVAASSWSKGLMLR